MSASDAHPVYVFEGFRLDTKRRVLYGADGKPIPLTPRVLDALSYFVERSGQLLTKEELLEALWPNVVVEEHNLNKTVSELRRVLGERPGEHRFIATKPGRGYRFVADVDTASVPELSNRRDKSDRLRPGGIAHHRVAATLVVAALIGVGVAFLLLGRAPQPQLMLSPLSLEKGVERRAVWSPDGSSVAYAASERVGAGYRLFIRDLGAATARPITGELTNPRVNQWLDDGRIVYADGLSLWSISPVSATPERLEGLDLSSVLTGAVSRDGTAAMIRRGDDGAWGLWTTPVADIALQKYDVAPLKLPSEILSASLEFSQDGRQILLTLVAPPEQIWILPFPPDAARPPRRALYRLPPVLANGASWLPDNAHIVVGTSDPAITTAPQLTIADTRSGSFRLLTNDDSGKAAPAVSPDGSRLVFLDQRADFDIVTLALEGGEVQPLIATDNREEQASWAAAAPVMAYVTTRRGHYEIWLHRFGDTDRPLVTPSDFPRRQWLFSPSPSPDGSRVIFQTVDWETGESYLWVRSAAGGPLERVTDRGANERAGSWSADGAWYAYSSRAPDGSEIVYRVRTSGRASPEPVLAPVVPSEFLPIWSPDGQWILVADGSMKLVSPQGTMIRELGIEPAPCGFARTAATVYCLRAPDGDGSRRLEALDLDGNVIDVIGSVGGQLAPRTSAGPLAPSLTLSLTPDGASLTYSVVHQSSNLWLLEGLTGIALP